MPPIRRTLKNVVHNYTEAQIKVRESTSNDPWGPSSTLMCEIADLTYNVVAFTEIMQMVWKRLNDHGKNWRHVYKSLVLLDYLIKTGSERVAQQCKENIFAIQTLKDFQHVEENKDQGLNVREKAKQLVQLLKDDERLRNERAKALKAKERLAQSPMGIGKGYNDSTIKQPSPTVHIETIGESYVGAPSDDRPKTESDHARPSSLGEEEMQLQLALAMSKEEHDEEEKLKQNDDIKLQIALEESRKQAAQDQQSMNSDLLGLSTVSSNDPWTTPLAKPPQKNPVPQAASNDPWSATASSQPSFDPWALPTSQSMHSLKTTSGDLDLWSSPPTLNNNKDDVDDAFDILSSRDSSQNLCADANTLSTINTFDPLGGIKPTVVSLENGRADDGKQEPSKEMAKRFLGQNADLVNLDELVSTGKNKGSTNPFAGIGNNPFEQPVTHVSMNELQAASGGFTQQYQGSMLPTTLMPINGLAESSNNHSQMVNPFL